MHSYISESMKPQVLLLALVVGLAVFDFDVSSADHQCVDPLPSPVTLDPNGASSFPTSNYEKQLAKESRDFKDWMRTVEGLVDENLKAEQQFRDSVSYPDCIYENECAETVQKAYFWQVPGFECWNVEPVSWVTCDTAEPKSSCPHTSICKEAVGVACRQRFTNQKLWVYCSGTGFTRMTIPVATSCIVVKNRCPEPGPINGNDTVDENDNGSGNDTVDENNNGSGNDTGDGGGTGTGAGGGNGAGTGTGGGSGTGTGAGGGNESTTKDPTGTTAGNGNGNL